MIGVGTQAPSDQQDVGTRRLSDVEKTRLVERACSLEERARGDFESAPSGSEALVDSRFARWCDAVAKGDAQGFLRYLSWRGLDAASARRALGPVAWTGEALPAWVEELDEIVAALESPPSAHLAAASPAVAPFLAYGLASLQREMSARGLAAHAELAPSMMAPLQRLLRLFLTPTLEHELEALRSERAPGPAAPQGTDPMRAELVRDLLDGGWRRLLLRYPPLARIVANAIARWRDAMLSFLERWESDRASVVERILGGRDPGALAEVGLSMSDPHHGGQSVVALRFAGGARVLYKPRSGALEETYFDLVRWMNEQAAPVRFRVLAVVERGTHCWVEWVEHAHVQSDDELRHFARACGGLLAVAHMLRATDLHTENLIAAGPDPVVIDLETVVPPDMRLIGADANLPHLAQKNSVLRTALLPWELELAGAASEIGAFAPLVGLRPLDPNSSPVPIPVSPTEPLWVPLPAEEISALLEDGFADTYRFLVERRDALMADGGALAAFAGRPVRMIFRDTSVYQRIGIRSLQPRALRDGVDRSLELEVLKRPLRHPTERPAQFEIFEAEERSLEALDIPYFDTRTDSHALILESGVELPGVLHRSGFEGVAASFSRWSEEDLAYQRELVHAAMLAKFAEAPHADLPEGAGEEPAERIAGATDSAAVDSAGLAADGSAVSTVDVLSAETERVLRRLESRAIWLWDRHATWIGPTRRAGRAGVRIGEIPLELTEGTAGVGLFLAAYAHATGSDDARALATGVLGWAESVASQGRSAGRSASHEAAGATVYALARSAAWLPGPALDAADRIAGEWSEHATLAAGAGARSAAAAWIHGFLALAQARGTSSAAGRNALSSAAMCGRAFAAARLRDEPDARGAARRDHGDATASAHAALVLAKLFHATGEGPFRDSARREVERAVFDADPRRAACRSSLLGITTLEAARLVGDPLDSALASAALAAARRTDDALDTLCCGTFGRVEALLVLADLLGRPELEEEARSLATRAASREGFPRFFGGRARGIWSPALLHGDAGVGYTLLHLSSPRALPSLLLWQ